MKLSDALQLLAKIAASKEQQPLDTSVEQVSMTPPLQQQHELIKDVFDEPEPQQMPCCDDELELLKSLAGIGVQQSTGQLPGQLPNIVDINPKKYAALSVINQSRG